MVHIGNFDLDKRAAIVAAISKDPLTQSKAAASTGADVLEIRLDLLGIDTPETAADLLKKLRSDTKLPCIATNRLQAEGGNWEGSEEDRITLLEEILPFTDAIDVELSADPELRDRLIKRAKEAGTTVIISSHDFERTPDKAVIRDILEKSRQAGADIAKLAVMPNSMQDVLALLEVTLSENNVCTIAMGQLGKHTRIVGPCYGSKLTYASVSNAVAPGQLKVHELKKALEMLQ
ncbi:type I 3-dehydroquinate dehydratase [Methanococcoides methylutens]|uniref:3-dehydroquinate dehydratase n=1 Tax=Methanococcoides methylutens MM1 TaxID=1434104 RepID=A0A0E3WYX1_METMT|nr:type I 3-dehydroquinate dehydratase [Methanococcoides methylutens]AKB84280.1 3-dehydroquinate dehydratase I [Methanococcoides methylutens MM1]